jgi:hypothetical protein
MASIKLLDPPNYSGDERHALIDFVLALKKSHIQDFLKQVELARSGTKQDLRERFQEAIDEGVVASPSQISALSQIPANTAVSIGITAVGTTFPGANLSVFIYS